MEPKVLTPEEADRMFEDIQGLTERDRLRRARMDEEDSFLTGAMGPKSEKVVREPIRTTGGTFTPPEGMDEHEYTAWKQAVERQAQVMSSSPERADEMAELRGTERYKQWRREFDDKYGLFRAAPDPWRDVLSTPEKYEPEDWIDESGLPERISPKDYPVEHILEIIALDKFNPRTRQSAYGWAEEKQHRLNQYAQELGRIERDRAQEDEAMDFIRKLGKSFPELQEALDNMDAAKD